ncbi:MAG: hypothetical protein ABGY95_00325 [Rubritalea sp.]|uniref:hypothetical protein n=1 Tax=Rubritalea sp. TaxID=2109375 RepID=UPI00324262E5
MKKKLWASGVTILLGAFLQVNAQVAPKKLNLSNFNEVRDYVIGDTANPEYFKVDWHKTVFDGVVDATAQDKPILLWLYFGGPLGNC